MKIRRYEIDEIFEKVSSFLYRYEADNDNQIVEFLVIPRFNVCVQRRKGSINFLFNHIYKVRTFRTYIIWFLLLSSVRYDSVYKALNYIGIAIELRRVSSKFQTRQWRYVDVIFVEWHFFGLFSAEKGTVTHVLSRKCYFRRLVNEYRIRQLCSSISWLDNYLPSTMTFSLDCRYYTEELAVSKGGHLINQNDLAFAQEILCELNKETLIEVSLKDYLSSLRAEVSVASDSIFYKSYTNLLAKLSFYEQNEEKITLAQSHGDFNAGQILKMNGKIKLIDWGDGGLFNRYFDFITIGLYSAQNGKFSTDSFPVELEVLKNNFNRDFITEKRRNLYILITFLEIFVNSFGEFQRMEGAYQRWLNATSRFL